MHIILFVFERTTAFWISGFVTGTQMSISELCDEHKCVCICARARACVCISVVRRLTLAGYC